MPKKIHPSLMPNEAEAFGGYPKHGDQHEDETDDAGVRVLYDEDDDEGEE